MGTRRKWIDSEIKNCGDPISGARETDELYALRTKGDTNDGESNLIGEIMKKSMHADEMEEKAGGGVLGRY